MKLPRSRGFYITLAIAVLGIVLLANAHLVYVASMSQPECVAHAKADTALKDRSTFGAAKSAC